MRNQVCEPCAKRKVRCDRRNPTCSNCKRRKQDHCVYPDLTPEERIKRLEETVRALKRDSLLQQSFKSPRSAVCEETPTSTLANTSSLQRDEERSIYLESQGWQAWVNVTRGREGVSQLGPGGTIHSSAKHLNHAFEGSLAKLQNGSPDTSSGWPFSQSEAHKLWDVFLKRVDPFIKLSFGWTRDRLQSSLIDSAQWELLSPGERALAVCSCYFGAVSLSKDECNVTFGKSKSSLLYEYRRHSEDLLTHTSMLTIDDIAMIKALCLYVKASVDIVSNQSLWSLMGLVSRSAELLGLHKDGQIIGLAPAETEERRRLWWQIQHIDLIMAVKNGSTPLTFTADWDTKLPLNIEEGDISSDSKTLPKERTGLTTFSYTLFACWVMNQQRKFRLRHQQSAVDRALLGPLTDDIIDELEAGLQTQFVQYCDPIKPADIILQISARALICVLRLRRMHEYRVTSENLDAGSHEKYLDLCMQELGYTIATYSQASLKPFCWLGETTFVWHALIAMLVDMPHLTDCSKIKAAWALLEDLYAAASFLKDFSEDKKRLRAAELLIAAWDACINKPGLENMTRPDFVAELEALVSDIEVNEVSVATGQRGTRVAEPVADDFPGVGESISGLLDFEFADIEWSYWQ